MNIQHLKYAVEIAKYGSISKASEALYVAQPNLSRAIKELERDLGIVIFDRSAKGIVLTPDGELLVQQAVRRRGSARCPSQSGRISLCLGRVPIPLWRGLRHVQGFARLLMEPSSNYVFQVLNVHCRSFVECMAAKTLPVGLLVCCNLVLIGNDKCVFSVI